MMIMISGFESNQLATRRLLRRERLRFREVRRLLRRRRRVFRPPTPGTVPDTKFSTPAEGLLAIANNLPAAPSVGSFRIGIQLNGGLIGSFNGSN